jgi:hypothetical protein
MNLITAGHIKVAEQGLGGCRRAPIVSGVGGARNNSARYAVPPMRPTLLDGGVYSSSGRAAVRRGCLVETGLFRYCTGSFMIWAALRCKS